MGRIVILGLDGGCWELLESLIDREYMPNLESLKIDSAFGFLGSTDPPVTAPAWVSFSTGVNPGKHSCFDFNKPQNSLTQLKPLQSWDIKAKTFYEILKESGKETILINLPGSYPPLTNFITFTSILTRGNNSVFPAKLKEEEEVFKNYRIFPDTSYLRKGDIKGYIKDIYDVEYKRFQVLKKILFRDFDCLFYLFSGGDWISHELYPQLLTKNAPQEAIEIFKLFDAIVYYILKNLNNDDSLIIVSDHGFKRSNGVVHLNEILLKNNLLFPDYLNPSPPLSHKMDENLFDKKEFVKFPPFLLKSALKNGFLRYSFKIVRKFGIPFPLFLKVDSKSSKCLMMTSESYGIMVNDKKRFNDGVVEIEEYEDLRKKIEKVLNELEYQGKKVFKNIYFKEEVYKGEYLEMAPDLIFGDSDWGYSSGIRTLEVDPFAECERGIHSQFGIFLAYGKNINKIEIPKGILSVVDIMPTILYLLGEKIPDNCDGRVLTLIIEESYLKKNKIKFFKAKKPLREEKEIENGEIAKRLKELGYMQ